MHTDDQLLPISALQHWLYCPRQCALIHLEQAWAENRFTAEGRILHQRAHDGPDESRPGLRIARGMSVRSLALGLSGQCDVVEFHADSTVLPIEYKRGKPKSHRADEVQLCAQALCLEEMLDLTPGTIPHGILFYGKPRRRTGITPSADYHSRRCDACSLIDICQPHALRFKKGAAAWFDRQFAPHLKSDISNFKSEI